MWDTREVTALTGVNRGTFERAKAPILSSFTSQENPPLAGVQRTIVNFARPYSNFITLLYIHPLLASII